MTYIYLLNSFLIFCSCILTQNTWVFGIGKIQSLYPTLTRPEKRTGTLGRVRSLLSRVLVNSHSTIRTPASEDKLVPSLFFFFFCEHAFSNVRHLKPFRVQFETSERNSGTALSLPIICYSLSGPSSEECDKLATQHNAASGTS